MSKDPAILFFTSDFLTGTMFMTNEQVGIYIRLLCAQHQHGGIIDKPSFNSMTNGHDVVRQKFQESEEGFFNARMMEEVERRNHKSENLSNAAFERWQKHKENQTKKVGQGVSIDVHNENIITVINYLNKQGNFSFKQNAEKNKKPIRARLNEDYKLEDFITVINYKIETWGKDQKMKDYIRPETIFGTKFESYLMAAKSNKITPMNNTLHSYNVAQEKLGLNG